MITLKHPLILISVLLWIGFLCAISFMEAWLKFRAPGVTLPIGLGIGRLVFNALNKMEILFMLIIIINLVFNYKTLQASAFILPALLAIIVLLQTLWLLPTLDVRAEAVINNEIVEKSNLHFWYVGFELTKLGLLITYVFTLFKN